MQQPLPIGATIGILGGGQLARMMCMAATRLGLKTIILDPDPQCPAAQMANGHIVAAYDDLDAAQQLAQQSSLVTYEFENVPLKTAQQLAQSWSIQPHPVALETAQDRFLEKKFLNDCGIETAAWHLVNDQMELIAAIGQLGGKALLKTRRMGYDGKGQVLIESQNDDEAQQALEQINHVPAIAEQLLDFDIEFSVIGARDYAGTIVFYDCPQNIHKEGILRKSIVPAAIPDSAIDYARNATRAILSALNYVGIIAVEFFLTKDGRVIANEFAPRVHNSGHWTEAACIISQFEQHIRAIAGYPLGDTRRHSDCEMYNLIGDDVNKVPELMQKPDVYLHLYGKADVRPGRKMGHYTHILSK